MKKKNNYIDNNSFLPIHQKKTININFRLIAVLQYDLIHFTKRKLLVPKVPPSACKKHLKNKQHKKKTMTYILHLLSFRNHFWITYHSDARRPVGHPDRSLTLAVLLRSGRSLNAALNQVLSRCRCGRKLVHWSIIIRKS